MSIIAAILIALVFLMITTIIFIRSDQYIARRRARENAPHILDASEAERRRKQGQKLLEKRARAKAESDAESKAERDAERRAIKRYRRRDEEESKATTHRTPRYMRVWRQIGAHLASAPPEPSILHAKHLAHGCDALHFERFTTREVRAYLMIRNQTLRAPSNARYEWELSGVPYLGALDIDTEYERDWFGILSYGDAQMLLRSVAPDAHDVYMRANEQESRADLSGVAIRPERSMLLWRLRDPEGVDAELMRDLVEGTVQTLRGMQSLWKVSAEEAVLAILGDVENHLSADIAGIVATKHPDPDLIERVLDVGLVDERSWVRASVMQAFPEQVSERCDLDLLRRAYKSYTAEEWELLVPLLPAQERDCLLKLWEIEPYTIAHCADVWRVLDEELELDEAEYARCWDHLLELVPYLFENTVPSKDEIEEIEQWCDLVVKVGQPLTNDSGVWVRDDIEGNSACSVSSWNLMRLGVSPYLSEQCHDVALALAYEFVERKPEASEYLNACAIWGGTRTFTYLLMWMRGGLAHGPHAGLQDAVVTLAERVGYEGGQLSVARDGALVGALEQAAAEKGGLEMAEDER